MKRFLHVAVPVLGLFSIISTQAQVNNSSAAGISKPAFVLENTTSNYGLRADVAGYWIEHAADSYAGGTGTEADPYQIATAEQLAKLCLEADGRNTKPNESYEVLKGVYFKQTADIDLSAYSSNGLQIGIATYFAGNYDGGGYTISGYNIDYTYSKLSAGESAGAALFLSCQNSTIKNIVMKDAHIKLAGTDMTDGSMMAVLLVTSGDQVTIENCSVSGDIELYAKGKGILVSSSAIAGYLTNSTIKGCISEGNLSNNAELTGDAQNTSFVEIGGIIAEAENTTVINCVNRAKANNVVTGKSDNTVINRIGGIVTWTNACKVINCSNQGTISSSMDNFVGKNQSRYMTGIASELNNGAVVQNCWNTADILVDKKENWTIGAIIAYKDESSLVSNCYYNREAANASNTSATATVFSTDEMKSQSFVNTLNQHLPEGAEEWAYQEDAYPILSKTEASNPTANLEVSAPSEIRVSAQAGGIRISTPNDAQLKAYTIQGALKLSKTISAGETVVALPAGLYLLQVGEESFKIYVNR